MNLWKGNVAVVISVCSNRGQEEKKTVTNSEQII